MKLLAAAALAAGLLSVWPALAEVEAPQLAHDIEVAFDPESRRLTVVDRISVAGRSQLTFRTADWLAVDQVQRQGHDIEYGYENGLWTVPLAGTSQQTLVIRLSGEVPALPPPQQARRTSGAVAGIEGSYLPGYAGWMPLTDDEWVRYRLRIEVPDDQRAIASGRLVEEETKAEAYFATFLSDVPSDVPSLFIGPYEVKERGYDGIRLRTYFHEDIASFADQYLETAAGYIAHFAQTIGGYPYDDFHIVSSPLPVGLGFANLTYIGRMIVPLPFMQGRSLAHEVLHNWWGNGVAVEYRSGNWAEGLTTYMADHGVAAAQGVEAEREMRLGWLRDFAALPPARDTAVTAFVAKRHQASQVIGYNKVAHIFHMLKEELGEEQFVEGLKAFWSRHKFSSAAWSDLQASFEAASGRDLSWFFDQWLERTGAPKVELLETKTAVEGDSHSVDVSLRQSQPTYRLRVPVEIETASGIVRRVAELDGPQATFEFDLAEAPLSVRIDPSFDLFRRLLPGESPPILRDVMLSQAVNAMVLSEDDSFAETAGALVRRMVDRTSRVVEVTGLDLPAGPSLVVGESAAITRLLERAGLGGIPQQFESASLAAWATQTGSGDPLVIVAAQNPEDLKAAVRSLPHYGRQSYVVFSGGKASDRGIWAAEASPLAVVLSN